MSVLDRESPSLQGWKQLPPGEGRLLLGARVKRGGVTLKAGADFGASAEQVISPLAEICRAGEGNQTHPWMDGGMQGWMDG